MRIIRKRFIAAAVCPSCDEVDRIVVEVAVPESMDGVACDADDEYSRRRCVTCGFADEFSTGSDTAAPGVPKGRPERPRSKPVNPVKVRILDPKELGL